MGILRFLLALSVVIVHTTPIFGRRLVGPTTAVQTFYVISGFYMALVLNEKYLARDKEGRPTYRLFITARLLRLFPAYLIVLAATFLVQSFVFPDSLYKYGHQLQDWRLHASALGIGSKIGLVLANIGLFGQDVAMFFAFNPQSGAPYYTSNFATEPLPFYKFMLVPQAWSLGVELWFYLCAPFLVRRKASVIAAIVVASVVLRGFLMLRGYTNDPWTYRFFPTELAFFLLGALDYKLYRFLRDRQLFRPLWGWIALTTTLAAVLLFPNLFDSSRAVLLIYFALVIPAIPFIFLLTKNTVIDRYIGELSYPLYISHMLCATVLTAFGLATGFYTAILAVLVSIFLFWFIDRPMDNFRHRLVARRKAA